MQALKKNDTVGQWVLDKNLGAGGQGAVWKVRYSLEKHSPPAALKLCSDNSAKARTRFRREIDLLRAQDDPGIVRIRDAGEHDGTPFFVMELASTSLDRVITADSAGTRLVRDSGHLLLVLLKQAASALAGLHSRGILHRDLKPGNVLLMLDPPEPVKAVLADLGVSVLEEEQGQLTAAHEVIGTPAFRAPESLVGKHTSASDVYAFGKTLEFVFAGGLPSSVGPGRCSRTGIFSHELWDCLDAILAKACAYKPSERFPNGQELLAAFPDSVVTVPGKAHFSATPAAVTLSVPEIATLALLIGECLAEPEWVSLTWFRKKVNLSPYQTSLALRRLVELDFIEIMEETDSDDARYVVCRPKAQGVRWAHSHQDDVESAMRQIAPPPNEPGANSSEDDIPF